MFEKLLQSRALPHLDAVLRKRRAEAAAGIARDHVLCQRRLAAFGALYASASYSWRYVAWWRAAARTTVRALVPAGLMSLRRASRLD